MGHDGGKVAILADRIETVRTGSGELAPEERAAPEQGPNHAPSWREELRQAIRTPAELGALLQLPAEFIAVAERAATGFRLLVPRGYAAKMTPGDVRDPLLRQVLPVAEEMSTPSGFTVDPVGDLAAQPLAGMLHKYSGRVLLVTTGACAVHCRYCFRRHFPYSEAPRSPDEWSDALAHIAADPSIDEVLLSGGDPWMLVDETLAELTRRIAAITHVRRLRVHTRMPIVLPERVTDSLIATFRETRLTPIVVVHANHPREIDPAVAAALGRLVDSGTPVLNQAVLLAGVNDDAEVLTELCRRLVDLRVLPYYLHQLDRVAGAAHFEVAEERGRTIVAELRRRLPGYAVPRYVRERAGGSSKEPIGE